MNVLRETTHRARRTYRCEVCSVAIDSGERYRLQVVEDGGLTQTKSHLSCAAFADAMFREYDSDEFSISLLEDWIGEASFGVIERALSSVPAPEADRGWRRWRILSGCTDDE